MGGDSATTADALGRREEGQTMASTALSSPWSRLPWSHPSPSCPKHPRRVREHRRHSLRMVRDLYTSLTARGQRAVRWSAAAWADPRFLLVVPLTGAGFWFYRRRYRDETGREPAGLGSLELHRPNRLPEHPLGRAACWSCLFCKPRAQGRFLSGALGPGSLRSVLFSLLRALG